MSSRIVGRVEVIFKEKGFGFIAAESMENVFFHISSVDRDTWNLLEKNSLVEFERVQSRRKPGSFEARNVQKTD